MGGRTSLIDSERETERELWRCVRCGEMRCHFPGRIWKGPEKGWVAWSCADHNMVEDEIGKHRATYCTGVRARVMELNRFNSRRYRAEYPPPKVFIQMCSSD